MNIDNIISICSVLSLGSILLVSIQEYFKRKYIISEIDNEKFDIYKELYFKAVKNPLGQYLSHSNSKEYLKDYCIQLLSDDKKSLLLSRETIKLLEKFHINDNKSNLSKLQDRIEKDFRLLNKKFGYNPSNFIDKIKWGFCFFTSIFLDFFIVFYIITCFSEPKYIDSDLLSFVFSISLPATFTTYYTLHNAYIMD